MDAWAEKEGGKADTHEPWRNMTVEPYIKDEWKAGGRGGTSFREIFRYMKEYMMQDLTIGIVVLTDGYAYFPKEEEACGVPVLWIIMDSNVQPPWGMSVHVKSSENDG